MNKPFFRPPAPTPREERPNLFALLGVLKNNPLEAWTKVHFEQAIVRDGLPFMPAVVVSDPDAIRHVLLENAANYRKDDLLQRILAPGLGQGLLTVEGAQWRRQRRAVAPMFARKTIYDFAPHMHAAIDDLVMQWKAVPEGTVLDVAQDITGLTLDVLRRTMFSHGFEKNPDAFRSAMRCYFDSIGRIDRLDALGLPEFLPRPTRGPERAALAFFKAAVDSIIEERRRLMESDQRDIPRDLLTLLLEAGDAHASEPLSEEEIRANIITFIAAGHETTANALSWSIYLLSQDNAWAARVADEAENVPTANEDPCEHLAVARAVIEEALRLYPSIAAISRVAIEADEIAGEAIRPGTMVIVAPYVLHRHRLLWDQPDIFDPSRFLGNSREQVHRFAYLPFGAGPRICIGSSFALQEATLALSKIVQRFEFRLAPGFEVEPLLRITLRPKGGLPMTLRRRGSAETPAPNA